MRHGLFEDRTPDFGGAIEIPAHHVPMFWACGVTPQAAVMESRPALAVAQPLGHMLITDARDSSNLVPAPGYA